MTDYETALRSAYNAFYEHPYKSDAMFNAMEKTADAIFHDTKDVSEERWVKLCDEFHAAFCNNAQTPAEKKVLNTLAFLSIL